MRHLTPRQRDALLRAAADRGELSSALKPQVSIAGRSYPLKGGIRVRPQEGPAVVLGATVAARLPEGLLNEGMRVDYLVGGERLPAYRVEVVWMDASGYRTELLTATPSYHADGTTIGKGPADDLSFFDASPASAFYAVVSKIGEYRDLSIPPVDRPRFNASGPERIQWSSYISEALDLIRSDTKIEFYDTPLGSGTAQPEAAVFGDAEPLWTFTEGVDFDLGELSVELPERRYAWVVVVDDVDGKDVPLAWAKVDNGTLKVRDSSVHIERITDSSSEIAHEVARRKADELGSNRVGLSFPVNYPPFFLWRGHPVLVRGIEKTPEGTWRRDYRARLASAAPDGPRGTVKAVGQLVRSTFAPKRVATFRRAPSVSRARYGFDHLGRLRFSGDFVALVPGRGLVFYPDRAAQKGISVTYETGRGIRVSR